MIESPKSAVWIRAATVWEIAIKPGLGHGDMPVSGQDALRYVQASGCRFFPIEPEHAAGVGALPARHADPFDRILIAQALAEPMPLITHAPARDSDTITEV